MMNLVKLPQLEIPCRWYTKILNEGGPKRSLGHFGRGRHLVYSHSFAGALL
jgi:hypothetical protein